MSLSVGVVGRADRASPLVPTVHRSTCLLTLIVAALCSRITPAISPPPFTALHHTIRLTHQPPRLRNHLGTPPDRTHHSTSSLCLAWLASLALAEPAPGVDTVHDVLLYSARTHGSKKGFAAREIDRVISEEKEVTKMVGGKEEKQKKTWNYFKLKPFDWMTYEEMLVATKELGSGLRKLGVGEEGTDSFFSIYASTS